MSKRRREEERDTRAAHPEHVARAQGMRREGRGETKRPWAGPTQKQLTRQDYMAGNSILKAAATCPFSAWNCYSYWAGTRSGCAGVCTGVCVCVGCGNGNRNALARVVVVVGFAGQLWICNFGNIDENWAINATLHCAANKQKVRWQWQRKRTHTHAHTHTRSRGSSSSSTHQSNKATTHEATKTTTTTTATTC